MSAGPSGAPLGRTPAIITPHEAEWIKGLAILLMMAHHLFGLPTLIRPANAYIPILADIPVEYWIGRFGKICAAMFLALSGYGFAIGPAARGWRYFAGKILRFMKVYWFYFALVVMIGAAFFQQPLPNGEPRFPTRPGQILLGLLTLRYAFAYEWWFAQTYVALVALAVPILRGAERPWLMAAGSMGAFLLGAAMDVLKINPPLLSISNVLIWQQPFVFGVIAARWGLLGRIAAHELKRAAILAAVLLAIGFAVVETFARAAMTPYLILVTPLFLLALHAGLQGGRLVSGTVIPWLGRLTLPLWLVHPFFCYYFFQDAVFWPRYSALVFLNLLAMTLAVVVPLEWVRRHAASLWPFAPRRSPA